jgi:hypothetical protein
MYRIIGADQKEYGPVTADEMRAWIAQHRLHASSLVQAEGSVGWKPLSLFPEFSGTLAATATAPAPFPTVPTAAFPEQRSNSMATAGLVMSCFALICCGGCGPFSILGIVFSIIGLTQANRDPAQTGKGVAIAGLVIGIISMLGTIVGTIIAAALGAFGSLMETLQ